VIFLGDYKNFEIWLESLDLNLQVRKCKSSKEMNILCDRIYEKLASLAQEKVKTYAMTYTEIMLRTALMYAFKQANANVKKIGDSLYHQHRCYDIAYNGLHGLFSDAVMSNGEMRMFADEKPTLLFDKCFLFSQYCNASRRYIYDFFDCGMVADAEHRFLAYFKFTFFSCLPYRLLNAVNCLYLIRWLVAFKREDLAHISDWIKELCSIEYDWILQQEQVYSRTITNELSQMHYKELLKLKKPIFAEQFSYQEVVNQLGMGTTKENFPLPLQFAENLIRATTYFFTNSSDGKRITAEKKTELIAQVLISCKRAETSCRSNWLMLRQLDRLVLPPPQKSWLISKSLKKKKVPPDEDVNKAIMDAYSEYKSFQHLLYILWRRQCGIYIAANVEQALQDYRPYHLAMLLSESMSIALRSATRMQETEHIQSQRLLSALKKDDALEDQLESLKISEKRAKLAVFPSGYFDGSQSFKAFIEEFPSDITVLQFSFDVNDILWLVRYHPSHEPYAIPFCHIASTGVGNSLFDRLKRILKESEATTSTKDIVATDFWNKRRELNAEMEKLVSEMQERFFGSLWPLCQPFSPKATQSSKASKVQAEIRNVGFCSAAAMILTHLLDYITNDEWTELITLMAERERSIKKELFDQLKFSTLKIRMGSKKKRCEGESYVFLVLPPSLSTIPWECMPVFQNALVSRIPSIFTLKALLVKHVVMPKPVNARNSYYVLNPTGNLPATQERLQGFVSNMKWQGVAGEIPKKDEVMKALKSQDMYVFLGHGSGRKYIGTSREFRNLDCRSVCLLMGCSSVEIMDEGRNFDGRSSVYDFMLAHCPCLVGCLWMITDGEADRFFMELMRFCFEELQLEANEQERNRKIAEKSIENCQKTPVKPKSEVKSSNDAYRFIMRGISKARTACKLPYLTGGSVVSYGLPTFAQY